LANRSLLFALVLLLMVQQRVGESVALFLLERAEKLINGFFAALTADGQIVAVCGREVAKITDDCHQRGSAERYLRDFLVVT
jgi:hypothetical protein